MPAMDPQLAERIAHLATDRQSGASELSRLARGILQESLAHGDTLEVAAALCRALPAMAPIWTSAVTAVRAVTAPEVWARAIARWTRSERMLERIAVDSLRTATPSLRIVTCSMSGSVLRVITALAAQQAVYVSCSEGRPALEGRRLASALAEATIPVTFFTDAALGTALGHADIVLVGADAVGSNAWINKVGTRPLAAAAQHAGLAVHVLATSDKLVAPRLWPHISRPDAPASEVWETPPAGIEVRNPYFESIPLDLAATVITDLGVLGGDMVAAACAAQDTDASRRALDELLAAL
jgi:translation initiation factor 2B subunit (eIF-2B alpha/beta/delta family)